MPALFDQRLAAAAFSVAVWAISAAPAAAQDAQVAFGGLRVEAGLPVEVTADELRVDQADGTATFSGDVLVVQGAMRLSAKEVLVVYAEGADGRTRIARLDASGGVVLASSNESAESRVAVYTVDEGRVVMSGDVVLTQGANVVTGDRMTVSLVDGTALVEGRVRTILQTGGNQ